jgi:MFS family permease
MKHYSQSPAIAATTSKERNHPIQVESWYLTYAILGATMGGMVPVLGPLFVLNRLGSPIYVGLAMAAFNLGGLAAPLWGKLADRLGIHRDLLLMASLLLTSIALAAFAFSSTLFFLLGLAFIQGIGVSGALTLGNLFIVEVHRQEEWNERIGWWYQTFNGSGQVVGMLLTAVLARIALAESLLIAAGLLTMALLPAALTPTVPSPLLSTRSNINTFSRSNWFYCEALGLIPRCLRR